MIDVGAIVIEICETCIENGDEYIEDVEVDITKIDEFGFE